MADSHDNDAPARVAIACRDVSVRLQLRRLLSDWPGIEVVGHVLSGEPIDDALRRLRATCLLVDAQSFGQLGRSDTPVTDVFLVDPIRAAETPTLPGSRALVRPADLTDVGRDDLFAIALREAVRPEAAKKAPPALDVLSPSKLSDVRLRRTIGHTLQGKFDVVAIGASTGGPEALSILFQGLTNRLSVPLVVTQHTAPDFTADLARALSSTGLPTDEAVDGAMLAPGRALLARGGRHLQIVRNEAALLARLDDGPPENWCRPSVDVMLRSLAALRPLRTLAVIMTGMGFDGLEGCQAIVAAGGEVIAQDEATSVVWGMPGSVAQAELCTSVLPLSCLAEAILAATGVVS